MMQLGLKLDKRDDGMFSVVPIIYLSFLYILSIPVFCILV